MPMLYLEKCTLVYIYACVYLFTTEKFGVKSGCIKTCKSGIWNERYETFVFFVSLFWNSLHTASF